MKDLSFTREFSFSTVKDGANFLAKIEKHPRLCERMVIIQSIREVNSQDITQAVKALCSKANKILPTDLCQRIEDSQNTETSPLGKQIMADLCENIQAAVQLDLPVCQDTGMAVIFVELGQDVHITGDLLTDAVNKGVAEAYTQDCLRCSVVSDPLERKNTNNNTPAVIHLSMVPGDKIKITAAPKGFGSENMSAVRMFTPSANEDDIAAFVADTILKAGSNPCPPVVVGVGIGGDFELCALLAKKALCRDTSLRNENPYYAKLEEKMLKMLNELNIGPQGFGGSTTALCVNIETFATHIAGLPVAVNVGCHVTRHAEIIL